MICPGADLLVIGSYSNFSTVAHVPTPRYGYYLTHAHSHITPAVAAMVSCFALIEAHQHSITVGFMNRRTRASKSLYFRGKCKEALL